jgi:hypothetical protein
MKPSKPFMIKILDGFAEVFLKEKLVRERPSPPE